MEQEKRAKYEDLAKVDRQRYDLEVRRSDPRMLPQSALYRSSLYLTHECHLFLVASLLAPRPLRSSQMSTYTYPPDWVESESEGEEGDQQSEGGNVKKKQKGKNKGTMGGAKDQQSEGQGGEKIKSPNKKSFSKSYTDDASLNRHTDDTNRTSTFTWFNKLETPRIAAIESRAAEVIGCSVERVEALQVVKYKQGQFFGPHHDTGVLFDDGSVEVRFSRTPQ